MSEFKCSDVVQQGCAAILQVMSLVLQSKSCY